MSYTDQQHQIRLKDVAPLNHQAEFSKIAARLDKAGLKLSVQKRHCTVDALQSVLQEKPLGIHFSGHGLRNTFEEVGEYHYLHKEDGDFLLLETIEGDSQLVSRKQLQQLIEASNAELLFVIVATCHSEFVGRIFAQVGAKFVICIDQEMEVADDAVINFTDTFYEMVLREQTSVQEAFTKAQLVVSI
jgi:hypothetical protein